MRRATIAGGSAASRRPGESGVTLIELLVVIIIMSIVSTMLIVTWVSLTNSYAHTTRSSDARDFARQAASRMERELRDAEAQVASGKYKGLPAVLWASANKIEFVTTFNRVGNDAPSAIPVAVMYYLDNGSLYMKRDADDDGSWDAGQRVVVPYMVNGSVPSGGSTPVFSYTYVEADGTFTSAKPTDDTTSLSLDQRARIISVTYELLVDLNPGHSPTHMNLTGTAQLRNQRRF